MKRRLLGLVLVAGMVLALPHSLRSQTVESGVSPVAFAWSELTILSGGTRNTLRVEVAHTDPQRRRGLMYRPSLAADAGMLFDYGESRPVAMWMKNTLISLDMLFIAGDGSIVNIAHDTTPLSLTTIRSAGPVRAVLELNAGTARRLGIGPGDKVEHGIFQP